MHYSSNLERRDMSQSDEFNLVGSDLSLLSAWCGRHDMTWSAVQSPTDTPSMVLIPKDARHPWETILLILQCPEIRLENGLGETLASGSNLPALLDAVDGGVAEPPSIRNRLLTGLTAIPAATLLGFIL